MSDDKDKVIILPENFHLNRTNWVQWKSKILTIVELQGKLGHLLGKTTAPEPAGATPTPAEVTELAKWNKNDLHAKATCTLNMDLSICGVEPFGLTAYEFWTALLAIKERRSELAVMNAEEYLKKCKYVPGSDIHAHFEELRRRRKACNEMASPLTDHRFAIIICQSMGDVYNHITAGLLTKSDPEDVILTILAVHDNEMLRTGQPQNPLGVMQTTGQGEPQTSAFMTAAKAIMICDWCLWKGHSKERCFCEGGGMAGQQPATWRSQPRPKKGSPADLAHPTPNAPAANVTTATPNAVLNYNVFMATITPAQLDSSDGMIRAYLDSGASHHYFTDRASFSEYLPLTPHSGNSAKRGADFTIIGVGCVHAEMIIDGRRSIVTFRNALHVPDLAANLISLSRIDAGGCNIQIKGGEMRIVGQDGGEPILVGRMTTNNLYEVALTRVDGKAIPNQGAGDSPRALASLTNAKAADVHTWHRRLGHASERTVMEMARSGAVEGMAIVGGMPQGKCEDCIKGKHPRMPFTSSSIEEDICERIYIDLTGRAREASFGGAYHSMTLHDGKSSFEALDLLQTKEARETLDSFSSFKTMAELQTNKKIHTRQRLCPIIIE